MEKIILSFEAIAQIDENTAYASSVFYNGLFKLNLKTETAEFIDLFPKEIVNGGWLHASAVFYDGKVYFAPRTGSFMAIYDTEQNSFESVQIPAIQQKNKKYNQTLKFVHAYVYKNCIWLIPSTYSGILKYDIRNRTFKILNDWVPDEGFVFRKTYVYDDNSLYIADRNKNVLLKFDFLSEKGKLFRVENYTGFMSAVKVNESIFFVPVNNEPILEWQFKKKAFIKHSGYPQALSEESPYFSKIYRYGEKLFLVPYKSDATLEMSLGNNSIRAIDDFIQGKALELYFMCETDEGIYFRNFEAGNLCQIRISKKTNEVGKFRLRMDNDSEKRAKLALQTFRKRHAKVVEGLKFDLQDYIWGI